MVWDGLGGSGRVWEVWEAQEDTHQPHPVLRKGGCQNLTPITGRCGVATDSLRTPSRCLPNPSLARQVCNLHTCLWKAFAA